LQLCAFAGGLSPQEALQHMKVADGFEVKLVASEPEFASRSPSASTSAVGCGSFNTCNIPRPPD